MTRDELFLLESFVQSKHRDGNKDFVARDLLLHLVRSRSGRVFVKAVFVCGGQRRLSSFGTG